MVILRLSAILMLACLYTSQANYCAFGTQTVCGADYITYPNICALQQANVSLKSMGACTQMMNPNGQMVSNCPKTYVPVCGSDGVTYGNACRLQNTGINKAYDGPCNVTGYTTPTIARTCDCPVDTTQVCSLGGNTFESQCVLNCSQQIAQNIGPCTSQCNCPRKYDPVCGIDGYTYDNECALNCVKITKVGKGPCPILATDCKYCSFMPTPVCGDDNKNYRNLCAAKCANVTLKSFGMCKSVDNPANTCNQCSALNSPICGTDGKNYKNECMCTCQGNCKKYSDGYCPNPDAYKCQQCVGVISKVCGQDGITYDNYCFAQCAKTDILYHGACIQANKQEQKQEVSYSVPQITGIGFITGVNTTVQQTVQEDECKTCNKKQNNYDADWTN